MSTSAINQFGNVMIDIETMGTNPYSAIISIAAVEFNIHTGAIGKTFYNNIDLSSCVTSDLKIDPDAVMWWMTQNDHAREKLKINPISLRSALLDLELFLSSCRQNEDNLKIWGNSARFDLGLLENAYEKINQAAPWEFWNERCLRTLSALRPEIKKNTLRNGTEHDAMADCLFQITYAVAIWKELTGV